MQAWANSVTARGSNLVTRNVVEVARCICTNGQADTYASITGITTDATHFIKIYVDTTYRHKGKYPADGSNVYRIVYAPQNQAILQVTTSKVIIEGLCIKDSLPNPNGTYGGNCIQLQDCDAGGYIQNCFLLDYKPGIVNDTADAHGHVIRIDA
ncbi:hypothetical protein, partial [Clostridium sp.]|uniref:hypothetical protein n=1 Tax=Clostridium sp. TaxID=1506 RepID=UPI002847ADBA